MNNGVDGGEGDAQPAQGGLAKEIEAIWQLCFDSYARSEVIIDKMCNDHGDDRVIQADAANLKAKLHRILRLADSCRYAFPSPGHQMQLREIMSEMHGVESAIGGSPPPHAMG